MAAENAPIVPRDVICSGTFKVNDAIVGALMEKLQKWTIENKVPEHHGWNHYIDVAMLGALAMTETGKSTPYQHLTVILACLLHDVDDHKLKKFGVPPPSEAEMKLGSYPRARSLLTGMSEKLIADVIEMISYTSVSINGGKVPDVPKWKIIPLDCDAMTAIGWSGIRRCIETAIGLGTCMVCPTTPLATNEDELAEIMKGRTLEAYSKKKGGSPSVIDHFYDKLLLLGNVHSKQHFLSEMAEQRMKVMKTWLFDTCKVLKMCKIDACIKPTGFVL